MKLTGSALALAAAVSLFAGCAADNDGEGGGNLAGLRPSKPSIDDYQKTAPDLNPAVIKVLNPPIESNNTDITSTSLGTEIIAETITAPIKVGQTCKGCDLIVLRDPLRPTELNVVDDFGKLFCRIWLDADGSVHKTDCN